MCTDLFRDCNPLVRYISIEYGLNLENLEFDQSLVPSDTFFQNNRIHYEL